MDDHEPDLTQAARNPRAHLLAALLEAFPPTPSVPYGRDSARYRKLYGSNPTAETSGMLVFRTSMLMNQWRRHIDDCLKEHGHSLVRWQALFELAANTPNETLTSIAARVGVVGPRMVTLLHDLEADGLIERQSDKSDRRSKKVVITSKGEEVAADLFNVLLELRDDLLVGVEESEILLMLDVVNLMSANLNRMTENKS